MKICLFNGMSEDNYIEDMIIKNLDKHEIKHLKLREMNIGYCRCCDTCSKLRRCVQKDDGIDVLEGYKDNEVIIYLTPIKYGAYSKELKKAIDRTLPIGDSKLLVKEGYMIHKIIYNNKKVIVIGVLDKENKDAERSFSSLVKANYYNMDWKSYKQVILYNNSKEDELENKIKYVFQGEIS